jgi:hypothetical protein
MTAIELLEYLKKSATTYRLAASASIARNKHMNEFRGDIEQEAIDAILVDFINAVGINHGIDYALYTADLKD